MKRTLIAMLTLALIAGTASAQGHRGGGPRGGDQGPGSGGDAIVANDGTIFVTRRVVDTGTNTSTTQLVAISPAGSQLWSVNLTNRHGFVLSGNNLLSLSESTTGGVTTTTVTALSTATGTQAWTATLNGRVTALEPFSGGTYALVVVPATTTGGAATRSLVALSNSGTVLWTVAL